MDDPFFSVTVVENGSQIRVGQMDTEIYVAEILSSEAELNAVDIGDFMVGINGILITKILATVETREEGLLIVHLQEKLDQLARPFTLQLCRRDLITPGRLRDRVAERRVFTDKFGFSRNIEFVMAERHEAARRKSGTEERDHAWTRYIRLVGGVERLSDTAAGPPAPPAESESVLQEGSDSAARSPATLPRCRPPLAPLWRSSAREGLPDRPILRYLARRGVPVAFRPRVWAQLSGAAARRAAAPAGYYASLLAGATGDGKVREAVSRDVDRTFPYQAFFGSEKGRGALSRLLLAIATHNDVIGYCQGLNFVAGAMLLACGGAEEDAFWLCVQLVEDILPADSYTRHLLARHVDQRVLESVVRTRMPALHAHVAGMGVPFSCFTFSWSVCLFTTALPMGTAMRVWDAVFCEGEIVLHRVALSLLRAHAPALLACHDPGTLINSARDIGATVIDADWLLNDALSPPLHRAAADARAAWSSVRGASFQPELARPHARARASTAPADALTVPAPPPAPVADTQSRAPTPSTQESVPRGGGESPIPIPHPRHERAASFGDAAALRGAAELFSPSAEETGGAVSDGDVPVPRAGAAGAHGTGTARRRGARVLGRGRVGRRSTPDGTAGGSAQSEDGRTSEAASTKGRGAVASVGGRTTTAARSDAGGRAWWRPLTWHAEFRRVRAQRRGAEEASTLPNDADGVVAFHPLPARPRRGLTEVVRDFVGPRRMAPVGPEEIERLRASEMPRVVNEIAHLQELRAKVHASRGRKGP